jgi:hypothetical protein
MSLIAMLMGADAVVVRPAEHSHKVGGQTEHHGDRVLDGREKVTDEDCLLTIGTESSYRMSAAVECKQKTPDHEKIRRLRPPLLSCCDFLH